jgi:hypothetical protein
MQGEGNSVVNSLLQLRRNFLTELYCLAQPAASRCHLPGLFFTTAAEVPNSSKGEKSLSLWVRVTRSAGEGFQKSSGRDAGA